MNRPLAVSLFAALVLGGCTWVQMAPGASAVRVLSGGAAPACEKRGEVAVSVKDSVAFYERNALRVSEELETLARNEAPGLQADTIQPLAPPANGEQRYAAYRCGGQAPTAGRPAAAPAESAKTYPVGG
ncbi:DUF4156 domain-containing protein [Lysobacter sp. Root983]|uniref:DUF4156 domain-containing protein n=1 Tax=Lysobacter sp. Root983 TaxID=1736613 RepID=UPI0009E7BB28|nr:DUF4156 domain-containing protein [Lysobacter sp. Root983]